MSHELDKPATGRRYCEFKITDEMIDRAAYALIGREINDWNPAGVIRSVLVAMGAEECYQGFVFRKETETGSEQDKPD